MKVDSQWYEVLEELGDGELLINILAAYCITPMINNNWEEWDYDAEEYFYLGFDKEYTTEEQVYNTLKQYPDGKYILHRYEWITTDYSEEEGLLWNSYDSSATYGISYELKDGELTYVSDSQG